MTPTCTSCAREIINRAPLSCHVCHDTLCHSQHCADRYDVPGSVGGGQVLCPECREKWRYYYGLLTAEVEGHRMQMKMIMDKWALWKLRRKA